MKDKHWTKWLYSLKEYIEESKQEENSGTVVILPSRTAQKEAEDIRFQVPESGKLEESFDFILSKESVEDDYPFFDALPCEIEINRFPLDPQTRITDHFRWTQCDPKELHILYQLERQPYKGPLLVLGHAREIEKELKHNLFLDAPPYLHADVAQYFEQLDAQYFAFMLDALSGKSPATLGIIENWLKALGNMQRDNAIPLHSKYELTQNGSLQVLTRENSIENMHRFRKLRNAATHGDIGEEQVDEFFQATYYLASFSKWVDEDFHIPEEGAPGFFSDYLAAGRSPYSGKF